MTTAPELETVMDLLGPALLVVVGGLLAGLIWLVLRVRREVLSLRSSDPTSGLVVLQNQLDGLRDQLRSSLAGGREELDRRLQETNRVVGEVRQGLGEVDRQVRSVNEVARDLRGLQELLRAPKVRGGMGEFLLADLLAEVLPAEHFDLQHAFPGGERVDAVISVGPRLVPVDAKFPLESFRRLAAAEDDGERKASRKALRVDVRRHVDAIATRYIRPGEGTYDFALMYIPAESVYHEGVLRSDDDGADLFEYAISRKVIPVSPQSFYAYLQVILLGLRGLTIEDKAQEILTRLGLIRTRLERFSESFDLAVRHLGNASRQLDESSRRLARLDAAVGELEGKEPAAEALDVARPVSVENDRAH
jgi:DNA recombination protein RmuC